MISTPVRVRIMTREGEAFVTSRYQGGDFYVTPDVGPATSTLRIEHLDESWTRMVACCVSHGPSGYIVPLLQMAKDAGLFDPPKSVTSMQFALACMFVDELEKRPKAVVENAQVVLGAERVPFAMDASDVRDASEAALAAYERKNAKRRGLSAQKAG
jgi:hypothetical protein